MQSTPSSTLVLESQGCVLVFFRDKCRVLTSQKGPTDKDTKRKIKQKSNSADEYELSRFKPALKTVIEVKDKMFSFT